MDKELMPFIEQERSELIDAMEVYVASRLPHLIQAIEAITEQNFQAAQSVIGEDDMLGVDACNPESNKVL